MAAKITISERAGQVAIWRDGVHVGDVPESGFSFTIAGQMSGLAGTRDSALAYARWHRDGTAVPTRLAQESAAVLDAWHRETMRLYPFTTTERAALMARGHSPAFIAGEPLESEHDL